MEELEKLSPAHCILLAVSLASESNIPALHILTATRSDVFDLELVLRILLSYLPESLDPQVYTGFLLNVAARHHGKPDPSHDFFTPQDAHIDVSQVAKLSDADARTQLHRLHLRSLHPSAHDGLSEILQSAPDDRMILFLISRAHAIDTETGLASHIRSLVEPFLDQSLFLRTWYISVVIPLIRFDFEYYPQDGFTTPLTALEALDGTDGVTTLLSRSVSAARAGTATSQLVGRDLRGIVGPWTYGAGQRKRRKLGYYPLPSHGEDTLAKYVKNDGHQKHRCTASKCGQVFPTHQTWRIHFDQTHTRMLNEAKQQALSSAPNDSFEVAQSAAELLTSDQVDDWQNVFGWIAHTAVDNFALSAKAIESWNGPSDVDLDGHEAQFPRAAELEDFLHLRYCQAAFASCYASVEDRPETIQSVHDVLTQLASIMGFEPPPDLATSVDLLPRIEQHTAALEKWPQQLLSLDSLLDTNHPLTNPSLETYGLLQMFTYSAHLLSSLDYPASVGHVTKLCFGSDAADALRLLQKVLQNLLSKPKLDEENWKSFRSTLLWLWDWGMDHGPEGPKDGYGVFGRIKIQPYEEELLRAICSAGQLQLATKTYMGQDVKQRPLPSDAVEQVVIELAYSHFDQASNGNRTRGSMKKASDLLAAFRPHFQTSPAYRRCSALIAGTHALSFYSLTLERGVPTLPVSIRQSADPVSLISTILDQNPHSYTKLDDLIDIARNLVISLPEESRFSSSSSDALAVSASSETEASRLTNATRRVTGMAIEAALAEDDFETAYSYVVNRISPSIQDAALPADDISWRAAFHAGRHTFPTTPARQTRRLEQRMDLLGQALSLAPPPALPEILAAWRRCEEELLARLAAEAAAEHDADDRAEQRLPNRTGVGAVPGGFGDVEIDPAFAAQPTRRELGRGAAEEAPMGLFEVARGAARAFGRSASGLGGASGAGRAGGAERPGSRASETSDDGIGGNGRVRKRDMVASAVTGGLASGIGWVLGATPNAETER